MYHLLIIEGQRECGNLTIFMFLQELFSLVDMLEIPNVINCLHLLGMYCILDT